MRTRGGSPASRRRALGLLGASLPGLTLACVRSEPPDRRVHVAMASLEAVGRLEIEVEGEPAEVVRTPGGVVARSLLCSHFGCRVQWREEARHYHCPCHEGRFDAEGRPVAGPPLRPLRLIPVEVAGHDILVGER